MAFLEVAGDVGGAALGRAQEAPHVGFDGHAPRTLVGTPVGVGDVAPDFSCRDHDPETWALDRFSLADTPRVIAAGGSSAGVADPELVEKARRRRFTADYKLKIVREAGSRASGCAGCPGTPGRGTRS